MTAKISLPVLKKQIVNEKKKVAELNASIKKMETSVSVKTDAYKTKLNKLKKQRVNKKELLINMEYMVKYITNEKAKKTKKGKINSKK